MANVSGSVNFNAAFTQINSAGLISPISLQAAVNQLHAAYGNGTGAASVDLMYAAQFTMASSASPQAIDLTSLLDIAGGAVDMLRVREFIVQVTDSVATHNLTVYASSASGWAFLPPTANALTVLANGGMLRLSDPYTVGSASGYVTGSASKKLLIDGGSNTVAFNLMILGCSALT